MKRRGRDRDRDRGRGRGRIKVLSISPLLSAQVSMRDLGSGMHIMHRTQPILSIAFSTLSSSLIITTTKS